MRESNDCSCLAWVAFYKFPTGPTCIAYLDLCLTTSTSTILMWLSMCSTRVGDLTLLPRGTPFEPKKLLVRWCNGCPPGLDTQFLCEYTHEDKSLRETLHYYPKISIVAIETPGRHKGEQPSQRTISQGLLSSH